MEGVAICVHRNISTRHPVYKLLAPHFYYNLAINEYVLNAQRLKSLKQIKFLHLK